MVSPNAAKSASLVKNVPCRPLCEGYFYQTILNNCHEYTKMHLNSASPPIAFCHHRQRNPLPTTPFDFAITLSAGWCCSMTHREKREEKWQIQGLKYRTHSMKHYLVACRKENSNQTDNKPTQNKCNWHLSYASCISLCQYALPRMLTIIPM